MDLGRHLARQCRPAQVAGSIDGMGRRRHNASKRCGVVLSPSRPEALALAGGRATAKLEKDPDILLLCFEPPCFGVSEARGRRADRRAMGTKNGPQPVSAEAQMGNAMEWRGRLGRGISSLHPTAFPPVYRVRQEGKPCWHSLDIEEHPAGRRSVRIANPSAALRHP